MGAVAVSHVPVLIPAPGAGGRAPFLPAADSGDHTSSSPLRGRLAFLREAGSVAVGQRVGERAGGVLPSLVAEWWGRVRGGGWAPVGGEIYQTDEMRSWQNHGEAEAWAGEDTTCFLVVD